MKVVDEKEKELLDILVKNGIKNDIQKIFLDFLNKDKLHSFGVEESDLQNLRIVKQLIQNNDILCNQEDNLSEYEYIKHFIASFLKTICEFNDDNYHNLIIKAINTGFYLCSNHFDISILYKHLNIVNTSIIKLLKQNLNHEVFELVGSLVKFSNFVLGVSSLSYYEKLLVDETRKIHKMAVIDPLSRLYNRLKFEEIKAMEFSRVRRYKMPLSICIIDIDNFKKINDTYGHFEGDKVIKTIGELLSKIIRRSDIAIRWGGEEFLILFTHTHLDEGFLACEKIRKTIESMEVDGIRFTVSLGLSEVSENDHTLEDAINRADKALYMAKTKGKNRTEIYKEI